MNKSPLTYVIVWFVMVLAAGYASGAPMEFPIGVPQPTVTMVFTLAGRGGNCSDCQWIAAEGPITEQTARDFEGFIKLLGFNVAGQTMVLNSNGGSLIAGLQLGEAVRSRKLSTMVGRTVQSGANVQQVVQGGCYSSCAYAFLGGVRRSAKTGELGFHQFRSSSISSRTNEASAQVAMGLLVAYLKKMSVDTALLTYAVGAAPAELARPDSDALFKLGVTNVRGTRVFSGWAVKPYNSGAIVTGTLPATGITENDQQEDQIISFYCRTDSPDRVFMSATWQYDDASPGSAATDSDNLHSAVFGSSVTIGGKVVRESSGYDSIVDAHVDSNDRWFLSYALTSEEFALANRMGDLHIQIDGPHSLGYFGFRFVPPTAGLADAARVAFKSCI